MSLPVVVHTRLEKAVSDNIFDHAMPLTDADRLAFASTQGHLLV